MMNNDMLQAIEYLRERADVSYEEATRLLEESGGDVMRAIVEMEKQGRLYSQQVSGNAQTDRGAQWEAEAQEAKGKAASFFQKAVKSRVIIEKKREDGEMETVANVSAPVAAGITIFAPYITLAATAIGIATGFQVKVEKPENTEL